MTSYSATSNTMEIYVEAKTLKSLLDAFGHMYSLQEIASAYSKGGQNVESVGIILHSMQKNNEIGKVGEANNKTRSKSFNNAEYFEPLSSSEDVDFRASNSKKNPASMGSVSNFIGNKCATITGVCKGVRASTLDVRESGKHPVNTSVSQADVKLDEEFENFLFEMLQHGFQVERDVIRKVLGQCGHDINKIIRGKSRGYMKATLPKKSLERLLDLTADNQYTKYEKKEDKLLDSEVTANKRGLQNVNVTSRDEPRSAEVNQIEMSMRRKERYEMEKGILSNLFTVPGRPKFPEENHPVRRSMVSRNIVGEHLEVADEEPVIKRISVSPTDKEEDDKYFVLRQAVKEYRSTMNEYYKAAAEAFAKGDRVRSFTLLEKGQFFYAKAREADEESAKKIFSASAADEEAQGAMSLNLQKLAPKEALRLVKCHLRNFSGIASFKYLRLLNGIDDEGATKASRKRLLAKFLEKESIKWTEDNNSGTIILRMDEIDPKSLSFVRGN